MLSAVKIRRKQFEKNLRVHPIGKIQDWKFVANSADKVVLEIELQLFPNNQQKIFRVYSGNQFEYWLVG